VTSAARSILSWLERGLRMGTDISYAMTSKEGVLKKCGECGQMILEKGIPVPPARKNKWSFLDSMEVGDSLMVTTARDFENVRTAMRQRKMRYRSLKDPSGTSWRLWRIR